MSSSAKAPALSQSGGIGITEARAQLGELVDRVRYRGTPIILEKMGKPVAAIISIEDMEKLTESRWERTRVIDEIRAQMAQSGLTDQELEELVNEAAAWAKANRD